MSPRRAVVMRRLLSSLALPGLLFIATLVAIAIAGPGHIDMATAFACVTRLMD